ncbi:MAG: acylphosphatase [bacterium]
MKARCVLYSGRVQGVGFRYAVKQLAAGYEVSGYVRNLPDGNVELRLQGAPEEVKAMEQAVMESYLQGFIQKTIAEDVAVDEKIKGFQILT